MGATGIVWAVAAAAFGLVGGVLCGRAAYRFVRRRLVAEATVAAAGEARWAVRLARGFAPLRPVARRLLRLRSVERVVEEATSLAEARTALLDREGLLSSALAAVIAAGVVAGAVSGSAVGGVAVSCCVVAAIVGAVRTRCEKRSLETREQVPEALRAMGACFQAGLSLPQALRQTAAEVGGHLGGVFDRAARRLATGGTTAEALAALREDVRVPELSFVAVALDVQHQSGGSIGRVLDSACDSVEGELGLLRSLRVQTAQAKLSARIVTVMPFLLVALFSLMSSDFLMPFFSSFTGMAILGLALAMEAAGVLLVRRMLRMGVEQ